MTMDQFPDGVAFGSLRDQVVEKLSNLEPGLVGKLTASAVPFSKRTNFESRVFSGLFALLVNPLGRLRHTQVPSRFFLLGRS